MKVSAVGFLFQNRIKGKGLRGYNYTCVIHKLNRDGNYKRNIVSSPLVNETHNDIVDSLTAKENVINQVLSITEKQKGTKFIGATIKDGIRETEVNSLISDKVFIVRTRDDFGKNHYRIQSRNKTQKTLAKNLHLMA